jgi:hypothetical protein
MAAEVYHTAISSNVRELGSVQTFQNERPMV